MDVNVSKDSKHISCALTWEIAQADPEKSEKIAQQKHVVEFLLSDDMSASMVTPLGCYLRSTTIDRISQIKC